MTKKKTKIEIGEKAKVNIKWEVKPIDYSHEAEFAIISKFAAKYGMNKNDVHVEPVFNVLRTNNNTGSVSEDLIGNIQDPKYQHELFKKWLEEREITDYDFDKIIEIDSSINEEIEYENYEKRKQYSIKWIRWSNFMSYGPDNYFDFTTLKGLTLLSSEPANQGGKSTFCLDLLRFLLFGKVTSRESDWTLSKVFNNHLPEATEVSVEGCVEIDGQDYLIKRVVTRPALKKRTEKSKVAQKVSYYKYVNGQTVDLDDDEVENSGGDNGRETNNIIKDAIGNERDFDLMICVNDANLKGLISLKDTDRGRLIARWVGLLPLEEKDKIAREKYNTVVSKSLLSNRYNKEELKTKIETLKSTNEQYAKRIKDDEKKVKTSEKRVTEYMKKRDELLSSKAKIDDKLASINIESLQNEIKNIIEDGKIKRAKVEDSKKKLVEYGDIIFNENEYLELNEQVSATNLKIGELRQEAKSIKQQIETLRKGEYCPTCGAKLKNVDNTKAIAEKEAEYNKIVEEGKQKAQLLAEFEKKLKELSEKRSQYNEKIKLSLIIDKIEVDIENLLSKYREKNKIIKEYEDNLSAIKANGNIDASLNVVNESMKAENTIINEFRDEISAMNVEIKTNERAIKECTDILDIIDKEQITIRNWKIYLEMIGKNGVSKMVIRYILPFINGELKHILNGVCDFDVEVSIDERNDVAFYHIHNGVRMSLASGSGFEQTVASLALRSVLSKVSAFSKPCFVVFDEILGGVADENYDQVKLLYDKIAKDYKFILQISHLKALYEWHDNIIKIKKVDDISVIQREK